MLLFGYQTVVNEWLGTTIPVSKTVLFHLGGLSMLIAISSPYFMVLNSKDIVMPQILMYVVLVSIAIPLKYFLGKQFGVEAIAAVGFYSWLAIIIPWVMFLSNRALKES